MNLLNQNFTSTARFPAMHVLRLFLALLVVWAHANYMLGHTPHQVVPGIGPGTFAVWTFFFLSGFLVTNSWMHHGNPLQFAVHRAARIWPALATAILFSTLVATITASPVWQWHALLSESWNDLTHMGPLGHGILHDSIPGSYPGTRYPGVLNGSLWSLRWEMCAYLFVLIAGVAGIFVKTYRANLVLLAALILLFINSYGQVLVYHGSHAVFDVSYILAEFVLGMLLAVNAQHITRLHVVVVAGFALLAGHYADHIIVKQWSLLSIPVLLVFFASIAPIWRLPDLRQDLSYGTYVFAWPVEQWIVWRFPGHTSLGIFVLATPVILVLAAISWRFVEQPALTWAKSAMNTQPVAPPPTLAST